MSAINPSQIRQDATRTFSIPKEDRQEKYKYRRIEGDTVVSIPMTAYWDRIHSALRDNTPLDIHPDLLESTNVKGYVVNTSFVSRYLATDNTKPFVVTVGHLSRMRAGRDKDMSPDDFANQVMPMTASALTRDQANKIHAAFVEICFDEQ